MSITLITIKRIEEELIVDGMIENNDVQVICSPCNLDLNRLMINTVCALIVEIGNVIAHFQFSIKKRLI